ncbi:MBL fold metallo-hydrolase [Streptomyces bacillaris]|uniref:MBL fold metallo-hydrolase n=1 Tax=Streptomyces TaxID=1883 RepID=UPI0002D2AA67|nr:MULTISPECIES: MBL fold metallo-hydrolase [Streptomyces]MYR37706.1 MBL fold metallo-hydrolase [Streptomyces sp. SID4944]ALC26376.1 flavodoxin [Streptomyces sp. CFMR 7]MBT3073048.1 MBL fold metallo-hydrolase [Streptomyces sp. COG21]MBT3081455.1 MBL fold metallo-hydrolase [Streptomyces sp. COG20]MBT3089611.1 MBL fold metallo-hydrolase [Streptomyces sp. CYG21]
MKPSYTAGPDIQVLPSALPIPGLGDQPVNAFLIRDGQPLLIDTGMPVDREGFLAALWSLIDPADLRWVVITHDDRDHTGALLPILEAAPRAKVITNAISLTRISEEFAIPPERVVTANPGSRIKLGDRELSFHRPPTFDSPGTLAAFDHSDGTLYSSDSFGTVLREIGEDFTELAEREFFDGFDILNRAIAPWTALADEAKFTASVRELARLRPERLLSAHGPTVRGRAVEPLFTAMARIPTLPAWLPGADLDLEAALDAHEAAATGQ